MKNGRNKENTVNVVKNSAIHNCPGICINIELSSLVILENNNIYHGRPILLRIFMVDNISIVNNHFVAAHKREGVINDTGVVYDMNTHIYFFSNQDIITDKILIINN